jgi:hypothetical protein
VLRFRRLPVIAVAAIACAACGGTATPRRVADSVLSVDLARTRQAGVGPAFRPGPIGNRAVAAGAPVGRLRCDHQAPGAYGAHIELFADDRGIVVPAGIGVAPPWRRQGPFVLGGRCVYPLRTAEPTGVVEVGTDGTRAVEGGFPGAVKAGAGRALEPGAGRARDPGAAHPIPTVGELFALWGQPLSSRRLGGFQAPGGTAVVAFVDGRRWGADPRAIPLRRHAQIVLELGPLVPPHAAYLFPRGL